MDLRPSVGMSFSTTFMDQSAITPAKARSVNWGGNWYSLGNV